MASFRRVLAATDLSVPARHAAERAAQLTQQLGATLDLVHVAPAAGQAQWQRFLATLAPELSQQMAGGAGAALQTLGNALQQQYSLSVSQHLATGAVLDEILCLSGALPADLLVLANRGAGFMRHLLLGSTAERLIGKSSCPTLVVKQVAHARYRRVLVPVDFSAASLAAVHCARDIAPQAQLILLHAYEAPFEGKLRQAGIDDKTLLGYQTAARQEAAQQLQLLAQRAGLDALGPTRSLLLHGAALRHIFEQEQEQDCDLIVIGKQGESRVEDLLLGSVTRRVLAESQCDVLVSTCR